LKIRDLAYVPGITFDERHALLPREGRDQIAF
jgi:hypothetical protein